MFDYYRWRALDCNWDALYFEHGWYIISLVTKD